MKYKTTQTDIKTAILTNVVFVRDRAMFAVPVSFAAISARFLLLLIKIHRVQWEN